MNLSPDDEVHVLRKELELKDMEIEEQQRMISELNELIGECRGLNEDYVVQLKEKEKNMSILQSMVDEFSQVNAMSWQFSQSLGGSGLDMGAATKDTSIMDKCLIDLFQERDGLALRLDDMEKELIEFKAALAQCEFEKERLQTDLRNLQRQAAAGPSGPSPGRTGLTRSATVSSAPASAAAAAAGAGAGAGAGVSFDAAAITLLKEQLVAMTRQRDEAAARAARAEQEAAGLRSDHEATQTKLKRRETIRRTETIGVASRVEELEQEVNQLQQQLFSVEESPLRAALDAATRDASEARARADMLEKENTMLHETIDDQSKALKILEAKRGAAEQETLRSKLAESATALVAKANDVIRVQQELQATQRSLADSERVVADKEAQIVELKRILTDCESKLDQLIIDCGARDTELEACAAEREANDIERSSLQAQMARLSNELASTKASVASKEAECAKLRGERDELLASLMALRKTSSEQQQQLEHLAAQARTHEIEKAKVQKMRDDVSNMQTIIDDARASVRDAQAHAQAMDRRFLEEQKARRSLHNDLMELCGNIRVHCRVRPILDADRVAKDALSLVTIVDKMELTIDKRKFEFDRVHEPTATSQDVFTEIMPLVTSFLDGFNVCIMAYGQTGSGKTHTMIGRCGPDGSPDMTGVIPCAVNEVFRIVEQRTEESTVSLTVSVVEIYNNNIRDLLGDPAASLEVVEGPDGAEVPQLQQTPVRGHRDVLDLVAAGMDARQKRPTDVNADSSRSHLIVTLTAHARPRVAGPATQSRLHLVDLAGSESHKLANTAKDGLNEAKNINRSLSALADVLQALDRKRANPAQHVPYRNSRLTHMLKDAIGGDSKMLLMLCVSPTSRFLSETLNCLRFGSSARQIQKGAAKKKVVDTPAEMPSPVAARSTAVAPAARPRPVESPRKPTRVIPARPTRLSSSSAHPAPAPAAAAAAVSAVAHTSAASASPSISSVQSPEPSEGDGIIPGTEADL